ncbi:MAG: FecR family protein [Adhaeribacter sp.]
MKHPYPSAADLAADESFINWVNQAGPQDDLYWQHWLQAHPGQEELLAQARSLVLLLSRQQQETLQDWESAQIWHNLAQARGQNPAGGGLFHLFRSRIAAAATGLLALAGGLALYQSYFPKQLHYATTYGERKTITLPDNSTVMLNANSRLSLPESWQEGEPRQVHLQGEAYFSVKHTASHQPFQVHTPDGVQVEVLGTEFSVSDRGAENQVVLASGKVQVRIAPEASAVQEQKLLMQPGQLVAMSEKTRQVSRKAVDPQLYLAWTQNKVVFDNTSLAEIARLLGQDYGCQVVFADKELAARRLTASFEVSSLGDLLETLAATLNLRIEKQDKKIIISKPSILSSPNSTTYAK